MSSSGGGLVETSVGVPAPLLFLCCHLGQWFPTDFASFGHFGKIWRHS